MKKNIKKIMIFVFTCVMFFAFSAFTALAEDGSAPTLSVSAGTATSITVSWTDQADEEIAGYQICSYNKSENTYSAVDTVPADTTSYTVSGLNSGTVYYYAVRSYSIGEGGEAVYGNYSNYAATATTPAIPSISSSTRTTTTLTIHFKSVTCSGYQIRYGKKSDMSDAKVITLSHTATSTKISGLTAGTKYYVQIRAYVTVPDTNTNIYSSYSSTTTTATTPLATNITSVSRTSATSLTVKFNGVTCSSYQIRYGKKSNMSDAKIATVSGTATSAKLTKLSSGVKYYVQIRSVVTVPGANICSSYSSKKNQLTKPAKMVISSTSTPSTTKIKVNWKAATATKYQLQYSTSSKFNSKKTVTLSNTTKSKTISGLKVGKTYYVRIRAYVTYNSEKIYGAWSETKKQKIYTNKKLVTSTKLMSSNKWASTTLCSVKKGATVRYISQTGRWYKVIYDGKTGYIYNLGFKKKGSTNISRSKVTAKNYTTYLDDIIFVKGKNRETLYKYVKSQMSYSYSKISSAQKKAKINSLEKVEKNQAELTAVAIRKKGGICYNFAAYTKTLLARAGHNVQYIYGANKNGDHCWVIIKTSEGYRHIDAVRGAFLYTDKTMHSSSKTKDFSWDETKYPACVAKK